jgi:N-methylhydantoinase A/oxoprolinase/acetone carboxylase beta subunit
MDRLLKEGVVQICGLTPTDIMHIKNDFSGYSREASFLGAEYMSYNLGISVEELCAGVYDEVKRRLYVNIVKILLENQDKHYMKKGVDQETEYFITRSYEAAKKGNKLIGLDFKTDFTLVGIGAPIHIFLDDVAKLLGTKALIPEYFEVANALGAVVGNIYASYSVEIRPNYTNAGITGYTVFGYNRKIAYKTLQEAEAFAVQEAKAGAFDEAVKRGASGEIAVTCDLHKNEGSARGGSVHLGTTVTAHAACSAGL